LLVFVATSASIAMTANLAAAVTIFESGTLGPTGVTWQQAIDGEVPATNIKNSVFTGVRFHLDLPVVTSRIGGHFLSPSNGTFFGAIVELDDENDFPDSGDLSTPDVLGNTLLTFPNPSGETNSNLSISLDTGWYALVFGSGLFGATTNGGALRNGSDIGDPSYIAYVGSRWKNSSPTNGIEFKDYHLTLEGTIVPESSTLIMTFVAFAFVVHKRISNKR